MLGGIGGRRRGRQRMRWLNDITDPIDANLSELRELVMRPGVLRLMGSQRVGHDWATEMNWCIYTIFKNSISFKIMLTVANKGKAINIKTLTHFPCYFYLFIIALWRCIKQKQKNTFCAPDAWCSFLCSWRPAEDSPPPLRWAGHSCLLLSEAFTGESKYSLKESFSRVLFICFKCFF